MVSCEEFRRSLTEFEVFHGGRELPALFIAHTETCHDCKVYLHDLAQIEEGIRETARIAVPPDLLGHLKSIPQRHRAQVAARNSVLIPAALLIAGALAARLVAGEAGLWVSSGMTLAGAFAIVAGVARARLIPD